MMDKPLNYKVISVILIFHILGVMVLLPSNFSLVNFGIFMVLYILTGCFGITLGYHRLLTHRSFQVPKWLEYVFATCGTLALQGDPIAWVTDHAAHHAGSDTEKDPHDSTKGFWYSHLTWLFPKEDNKAKLGIADMRNDPYYKFLRKFHWLPSVILGVILGVTLGWSAMIWGIFFRTCFVYHVTWSVNSVCHIWGNRPFQNLSKDNSTNNWIVGILAFGEGWHNNHHAWQFSPKHGIEKYQIDFTWLVILTLKKLGLARNLKSIPTSS
jgi:sn-1 stearoyl-lipid 9-desaturase